MRATVTPFAPLDAGPATACLPPCAGLGFKPCHFDAIEAAAPMVGFFEIHAENYLVAGGPMRHMLERLRADHPISVHGVGLSLGGAEPVDAHHLERVAELVARIEPAGFSEHLAWSAHAGRYFGDLLPPRYDGASLQHTCDNIDRVQTRLGRTILVENPATYVRFADAQMEEADFIDEVVRRSGCGLLLDLTNALISATNHSESEAAATAALARYFDALPLQAVGEVHLAGHACEHPDGRPLLIDDHGSAVSEAVWRHYAALLARIGPRPTLIERDNAIPPLAELLAEAARADALLAHAGASAASGQADHERAHVHRASHAGVAAPAPGVTGAAP